jgi:hypothetical protein
MGANHQLESKLEEELKHRQPQELENMKLLVQLLPVQEAGHPPQPNQINLLRCNLA